jgi:hypothetical protein
MAALLYDEYVMPISTDASVPRKTRINPLNHHDIVCGKTFDYYTSTSMTGGFQVLTMGTEGAIKSGVLMHSPSLTRGDSIDYCIEFAGKPHIMSLVAGYHRTIFSVYDGKRMLAEYVKLGINWSPSRAVECDDGNLYFSTHCGGDFSLPELDTWRVLDFRLPGVTHTGSHLCASGTNGAIYCIMGWIGGRVLSARDPRMPSATHLCHSLVNITNVDGIVYATVSGDDEVVAACIYDERADAMIGTTAIVDANATGICRLVPKKYN